MTIFHQTRELRFDENGERSTSHFYLNMLIQRDCVNEILAATGGCLPQDYNCVK